jgi:hypothetical protein
MDISRQQIAQLEWANYAATLPIAQVTPGMEIRLSEEVITTSNIFFPYLDVTHACLLRATPETVEPLIDQVIAYFQASALPITVFISPACTPPDLPERLSRRGFVKNEGEEAWLAWPHLDQTVLPPIQPTVRVKSITRAEVPLFVETMMLAFEMPAELAPYMVQLTEPSVSLPGVYHYLATVDDQPVGTCSLMCFEEYGIIGGTGVLPAYRGTRAARNMAICVAREAQIQKIETLLLQTASAAPLERFLRIAGFKKMFTRTSYTFHE